jgi:transcriptional regulator of arginine metabolism
MPAGVKPAAANSKRMRQEAIRKVIRARHVATQEELGDMLASEGFRVTQATLSRDLQQLGALRVSRPDGGTAYELDPVQAGSAPVLSELGQQITSIADNELIVVLRTRPGMASAVALAIDTARLPECLGTLAGDDTIFATPSRGTMSRKLAQIFRHIFGTGETP